MMKLRFVVLMVLLVSSLAVARIDAQDSFTITESNKTVSFSVTNTDVHNALPIKVSLVGPFASTISPFPDALSPGETKQFTAKITTHPNLEDQTYQASIVAKLGNMTETKTIQLTFNDLAQAGEETPIGTGFFGLGGLNLPALPAEWLNAGLVIILIIIVVAVVARVYKRAKTHQQSGGN